MKCSQVIFLIFGVLVCFFLIATNTIAEGELGSGRHPSTTEDLLAPLTESNVTEVGTGASTLSIPMNTEHVFGNLQVETQDSGRPSPATGVYLLSQVVPLEGLVTKLRMCGFLLDQDRETIPRETIEITLFAFVIAYRLMGDSYRQLYQPYPFSFIINSTDIFGCGENDITNLEWVLAQGDRIGVLVQQIQCFPFFVDSSVAISCPIHVNLVDPIENCSQAHYFPSTASVGGPGIPQELNINDGNAEDIFINLDITVFNESASNLFNKGEISTLTCALNSPRRTPDPSVNPTAIALPIIFGIILALLIISLAAGIIYHHCNKLSTRSQKVEAHDNIMVVINPDPSFTACYLRADQLRQSQIFSESDNHESVNQRASYITGSYVINCIACEENNACGEGQYCDPANCEKGLKRQLKNLELKEVLIENIGLREYLGSGHFGVVYRGLLQYFGGSETKEVAVKTMQNDACEEEKIKFLQEAAIMGQFNNPYVVKLYGVITSSCPYMIICELMSKGDLRRYLHTIRISGIQDYNEIGGMLLNHSREIVSAMVYLSTRGYIHRDLAARNILVSKEGICKISDFGLSTDLQDEDYYVAQSGLVPLRWTAPEALLHSKFSTSSDVWSFGIVLHEIWSLASQPYRTLTNKQVLHQILNGYRLASPPGCPRSVYEIMIACWHPESSNRPSFSELNTSLHKSDSVLLEWSDQDKATYSEKARTIGAAYQEGQMLHKDLHKRYEVHY